MKKKILSLFVFYLLFINLSAGQNEQQIVNFNTVTTNLILENSNWNYYDLEQEPPNVGSFNWTQLNYDDTTWSSGNAEFGYGDSQTTEINNNTKTAYFRKTFNVTDTSQFDILEIEAVRDDGIVVYINGSEVWRDNMPSGAVNYSTFASTTVSGSDESTFFSNTISNLLTNGNNSIAVEIHQRNATSSDISFNLRLTGVNADATVINRGPYLQMGTTTSVMVKWNTLTATKSKINYGSTLGNLDNIVSDNSLKTEHELVINNLNPNTKYYYSIQDDNGIYLSENDQIYVKTAPTTGTDQFVRAWILGDAGTANQNQRNVRDRYYNYVENASQNPDQTDMILFLGDNAYNSGTQNEYQNAVFNIYDDMLRKSVAWSTLGNHDGFSAQSSTQSGPYYDIFSFPKAAEAGGMPSGTEAYYSFDYANIHFIVLESYRLENNQAQIDWCTSDIQNTSQDWIVALFHHPAYTKGSHNSDSESNLIAMRQNFLPILEDNGVDLILSGHSHSYERSYFLNGHYGTSGTFNTNTNTVGSNGNLSGRADTSDGAYVKDITETDGAVYITTGSAGKVSGGSLNHNAMFSSINQLGSCVMEVSNGTGTSQNLTVKFINDSGNITDYFTINKTNTTLSVKNVNIEKGNIKIFPIPSANNFNVKILNDEVLKYIRIYNNTGKLVKETTSNIINLEKVSSGMYIAEITTNATTYYKSIFKE